jgi:predicted hotdog family 3-hydroxylacyl-ACP dehydratase
MTESTETEQPEDVAITELLPHRPPMLRVDRILYVDDVCARARYTVQPDDPFLEEGRVMPEMLIETIAQTVAGVQGWIARQKGEPMPQGMLVGLQEVAFFEDVVPGDELRIYVEKEVERSSLLIVRCWLSCGERSIIEGVLKFYVGAPPA